MQRGFSSRPTSINDLKAQVKPKLKSSKLERPKVILLAYLLVDAAAAGSSLKKFTNHHHHPPKD